MSFLHFNNAYTSIHIINEYEDKYCKFVFVNQFLPGKSFISRLTSNFENIGFDLVSTNELTDDVQLFIYKPAKWTLNNKIHNPHTVIHYYIAKQHLYPPYTTPELQVLQNDIAESNTLFVARYHPNNIILDHMKTPIDIICNSNTWYPPNLNIVQSWLQKPLENPTVFDKLKLYRNGSNSKISTIVYYDHKTETCFSNYADFYDFYSYEEPREPEHTNTYIGIGTALIVVISVFLFGNSQSSKN